MSARAQEESRLAPYLTHLQDLPFVRSACLELPADTPEADALLAIETVRGEPHHFYVRVDRSHLSAAAPDGLAVAARRHGAHPWIVFAPHVGPPMAARLRDQGIAFVDRAGNRYLALGEEHIAEIVGRPPQVGDPASRELGEAGYRVAFALLAEGALTAAPVRDIAASAGVGKSTVSNVLRRLEADGFVTRHRGSGHLHRRAELIDRWVAGYLDTLRPRLWIGAYRTPDNAPDALEARLRAHLGTRWAYGGAAAAWRLTEYYRSPVTVIHAPEFDPGAARALRALPAQDGPLRVVGVPGPLAFQGAAADTAHPLLVYAELWASDDDRARNAALEIRERYLQDGR
jgi:AcrR family transcriptional regulator